MEDLKQLIDKKLYLSRNENGDNILGFFFASDVRDKILKFRRIIETFEISELHKRGNSDNPYCVLDYIKEKFDEVFGDFEK